jgi:chemotaxis protein CheD
MSQITVKLADFAANNNSNDVLIVYGIGSTLAVILYDEGTKTGGIVHFMLPNSARGSARAEDYPAMYADTGIPQLVKSCVEMGARRDAFSARLAGGALMLGEGISQSISDGNLSAARNILSKLGIDVTAENTGGHHMRTVRLDIATGKVSLKRPGSNWEELR